VQQLPPYRIYTKPYYIKPDPYALTYKEFIEEHKRKEKIEEINTI